MKAERLKRVFRQWLRVPTLTVMATLSLSALAAPVPVVDSQPVGGASTDISEVPEVLPNMQPVAQAREITATTGKGDDATGTAYLLNTIERMQQEVMELRGQLEEQQFQINQLKQEGRDRYLDLDERITRQGNGNGNGSSAKPFLPEMRVPVGTTPETNMTGTTVLKSQDKAVGMDAEAKDKAALAAEEKAYQSAFQLIREKEFDQAQQALKKQLDEFPAGKYADNARYWLGEVQMAQGNYPEAGDTFQRVLNDYPDSPKVPDATYKLGRVYDLLGDKGKAKATLQSVVKQYPDTAAARLSDTYLRSMPDS